MLDVDNYAGGYSERWARVEGIMVEVVRGGRHRI
jgi:hypothetical protein